MIEFYKDSLQKTNVDSNRAYCLYILSYYYQNYRPDSALLFAQSAYSLAEKSHFTRGKVGAMGQIALAFNNLGNFSKALENYLRQLKLVEKQGDHYTIASTYMSIALVYNTQKDTKEALRYARKADSIAIAIRKVEPELHLYTSLNMGDIFSNDNQLDSASIYTLRCYEGAVALQKPLIIGSALNNLGNILFKSANYDQSQAYFRQSIPYLDSMQDYQTLAECYYGLAQVFHKKKQGDSALYYAMQSFDLSTENKFLKHAVNASRFLSILYEKEKNLDSAFVYQSRFVALKDSFDNAEKIKQLQNLTMTEQLRQDQMAQDLAKQQKQRKLTLELILVGIFIPVLFLFTAFISSRKVSQRIIQFSGIFSILFLFEYITILIHPWVMKTSGHSPVIEIFIFIAIASILSPTHHKVEHWLRGKLERRYEARVRREEAVRAAALAKAAAEEARAAE